VSRFAKTGKRVNDAEKDDSPEYRLRARRKGMNAAPNSNSPESASMAAYTARGRWLAGIALAAAIVASAVGWIHPVITLPVIAILGTLIAVGYRVTATGGVASRTQALSVDSANVAAPAAAIVQAIPEAALLVDGQNRLVAGNVAAAALFGRLRTNEAISLTTRNPQILEALSKALSGETLNFEIEERVPVERSLDAHVAPIVFGHERPNLFLLVFRDRTQERRIEKMRVDFVANASHELRTPLASLSGFIDTLQGPAKDDPAAREKFLGIMGDQARRMARLIDDLMSLSRIELSLHLQPQTVIDLTGVADTACDLLAPLAREQGVAIDIKQETAPLDVRGDRDELLRVAENLIENALKYGASGKRVEVILREEGEDALLSVRDFGPGIAPEHLPRLTERFYRVDVERSRTQGGTGLGLALVKHILARHRGRLTIESAPGEGAVFTARIPRAY
jgi:two-component system phosphate regulon sensor histidine kinase PhoR